MKKSLFYWAFLAFVGISLTACSSDDSITDNEKPVIPNSNNNEVILTGTIGIGSDGTTRSISDAGAKSWTVGDEICVQYETNSGSYAKAKGRITEGGGTQKAKFTATLVNPKNDGYIGFAYPYDKVTANGGNATDFTFNYDAYNNQDGTTSGITSSGLDYACSESAVRMEVNGTKAKLKADAPLENQFCMYKFTIADSKTATLLEIIIANIDNFTTPKKTYYVKPASAANVFYVALEPKANGDKVKIVASISDASAGAMKLDSEYKINQISASDYGKFICVDATDGNQAYLCTYDNSSTATVCEHTYSTSTNFVKDKLYTATLSTSTKTLTPKAVVAHVGEVTNYCTKFLALALTDVYNGVKSLEDAQGLIGGGSWLNDHKIKIDNTVYKDLVMNESGGKIDEVQENSQDANHYATTNITSAPLSDGSTSVSKGWRVPCVTDLRNILSHVSGAPSAINPLGIMDHQGKYFNNNSAGYYRGVNTLAYQLNSVLFSDTGTGIDEEYYWLSSQVINTGGSLMSDRAWRYSFAADYFVWTSGEDNSKTRLVFAY